MSEKVRYGIAILLWLIAMWLLFGDGVSAQEGDSSTVTIPVSGSIASTGTISPTMTVDCIGWNSPSCTVVVQMVDDRPLAIELITAVGVGKPYDQKGDPELGLWEMTLDFGQVPCWLGRPWARFYLKGMLDEPCEWVPPGVWVCPSQDVYGMAIFETACVAFPQVKKE